MVLAMEKIPKYVMISDLIRKDIANGSYIEGDQIPSCRDLALKMNASYLTVVNALKLLESEGLISSVPGKGNFIAKAGRKAPVTSVRTGFLMDTKGDLFQNFFSSVSREFENRNTYFVPLNSSMVAEGLSEEELFARIDKYASIGVENLIILGQRHFPFKHFNTIASKFENIVYVMHYDADENIQTPNANIIVPDFRKIGQIAAGHLLQNGWKNIAFLTYETLDEGLRRKYGTSKSPSDMLVLDGIEDILRKNEFADVITENALMDDPAADFKITKVLSLEKPAFISMGDSRYRRILNIAGKMGLKEGRDFGFIGMYNTPWADAWNLDTISIRENEIAKLAVQAIIENWKNRRIKIEPELVTRKK